VIFNGEPIPDAELEIWKTRVNLETNPVTYLSIDPGKSNGVCGYDKKYNIVFMGTVREEDMTNFLNCFDNLAVCVVESYRLYPNKRKQQIYSDMLTSRVIGRVEGWAARKGIKLVMQPASIKPVGYAWIDKKPLPKTNPHNHEWDAHVHFMYWAISKGKIDASILLELNKGKKNDPAN
jgi:predicted Zn-ribbon and HTH transcriptional regulator